MQRVTAFSYANLNQNGTISSQTTKIIPEFLKKSKGNSLNWNNSALAWLKNGHFGISTLFFIIFSLFTSISAMAASVTLEWDPNSQTIDGYRIYQRNEGQRYDYDSPIWEGKETTSTVSNLKNGTIFYFVVRAYKDNLESPDSNEVRFDAPTLSPPKAQAGDDQLALADTEIFLDGSASSDPDGNNIHFQWEQTAGKAVAILDYDTDHPSFITPSVTNPEKLAFKLKVTDEDNLTATDTCQVTVYPKGANDSDNDGISDEDEISIHGTDPGNPDTDGDGVNDGEELNAGTDPTVVDLPIGSEVIIDNGTPETSSTGRWRSSSGASYYGSQSVYSDDLGDSYAFEMPAKGVYEISLWWTYFKNRCSRVPIKIYNVDQLLDTVYINQLEDDGQWNSLGSYHFSGSAKIVVVSKGLCTVNADAAKFTYEGYYKNEVIIGNGSQGTSQIGNWRSSLGASSYSSSSVYSNNSGDTYTFKAPANGSYDVSLWWTYFSNRCSNIPVEIYNGDQLIDTVRVNQLENDGQWNGLGSFEFSGTAKVVLISDGGCTVNADALKLSPATAKDEIIIDNDDTSTSSNGIWRKSLGSNYHGSQSVFSDDPGDTYTFKTTAKGTYDVSLWWTFYNNRCDNLPVEIYDASQLIDTVYVNQLENGGQWNSLGTFTFSDAAAIKIVSEGGCTANADAVKLMKSNN